MSGPKNLAELIIRSIITRNDHRDVQYNEVCKELHDLKSQLVENLCAGCGLFEPIATNLTVCMREGCYNSYCDNCVYSDEHVQTVRLNIICNSCASYNCCAKYDCDNKNLFVCDFCGLKVCDGHRVATFCSNYCKDLHSKALLKKK